MNDIQTGTLIPYLTEMFRFQAWMALGKVASPVSGKVERDLGAARQMIDLLSELENRTEGNRSADETKMLQGVLTELRLNFMDESKKPPPEKEEADEAKASSGEEASAKANETADASEEAEPSTADHEAEKTESS
jgi:hypothetical protein